MVDPRDVLEGNTPSFSIHGAIDTSESVIDISKQGLVCVLGCLALDMIILLGKIVSLYEDSQSGVQISKYCSSIQCRVAMRRGRNRGLEPLGIQ